MKVNEKLFHLTMERDGCGSIIIAAKWGFPNTDEALAFQQALLEFRGQAQAPVVDQGKTAASEPATPDPLGLAPGKDVDDLSTIEPARRARPRKPAPEVKPEAPKEEPAKTPAEIAIETDTAAQQVKTGRLADAKTFRDVMTFFEATLPEPGLYFRETDETAKAAKLKAAVDEIVAQCDTHRDAVPVIARADKSSLRARIERALEMDDVQRSNA